MKRVLILTFFFEPDLSAGSFRVTPIAKELARRMGGDGQVEVFTTQPNRYTEYLVESPALEVVDNLTIRRLEVPSHSGGILDQGKAFLQYAFQVISALKGRKYDAVFSTSGRMMTSTLAVMVAIWKRRPVFLDIRDIFPDTAKDLLAGSPLRFFLPAVALLEKFVVRRADKVNLVSEGFRAYFEAIDGSKEFLFHTNGIDEEFLGRDYSRHRSGEPGVILYAGNIGFGQGLEHIVPGLAKGVEGRYVVRVVGAGGRQDILEQNVGESGATNVEFLPPVKRDELYEMYAEADVLFLHLNDVDAFKKVLPSKIFEYGATGKPILAGVGGYAASFLEHEVSNAKVFEPCNIHGAIAALDDLKMEHVDRGSFVKKYSRSNITRSMVEEILDLLNHHNP